ncbi:hypothetical protein MANES_01G015600v8 [Manihot esculenta]|uniref:Uncharacterized protein n=1 Tax=Manihot esculenta TaxID=3983 RepID=A0A2C9WH89_MANES|nr:hypothetical protein MANES_01G015600v8 [Manihot esculenta]
MISSSAFCINIERYRRRKRYQRLKHKKTCRRWKIKVKLRVQPKVSSAMKLLKGCRDSYVRMMLCFAGHLAQFNTGNVFLFKRIPKPSFSF